MRGVNKVIIIGNLGADPEHRKFDGDGSVTNISVATSEQWTDKQSGEKREATEWHRISLFNRLAEIAAQYLRKGSKVYIEGQLKTRKYQATDGTDRYVTEVRASQMQMLDSAGENNQQQGGYNQPAQQSNQKQGFQNNTTNQGYQNQPGGGHQQNTNQAPINQGVNNAPAMNGGGPVDDDIPFFKHFDGQF